MLAALNPFSDSGAAAPIMLWRSNTQVLYPGRERVSKDVDGAADSLVGWRCGDILGSLFFAHKRLPKQRSWQTGDFRGLWYSNQVRC
jgi:hypothetical protein